MNTQNDERPLSEVVRELSITNKRLGNLDDQIREQIKAIEERLRKLKPTTKPVDVTFPPWGKLGWSGRRNRWRLVVVDDESCEDLLQMPALCRTDACFVLPKLLERLGIS
jgi:hypothetical protein